MWRRRRASIIKLYISYHFRIARKKSLKWGDRKKMFRFERTSGHLVSRWCRAMKINCSRKWTFSLIFTVVSLFCYFFLMRIIQFEAIFNFGSAKMCWEMSQIPSHHDCLVSSAKWNFLFGICSRNVTVKFVLGREWDSQWEEPFFPQFPFLPSRNIKCQNEESRFG